MEDKVLGLGKGIHRVPTVGSEGELLDCVNLIAKGGELVNAPRLMNIKEEISPGNKRNVEIDGTLLFVHKIDSIQHLIYSKRREAGVKPVGPAARVIKVKKECTSEVTEDETTKITEWKAEWAAQGVGVTGVYEIQVNTLLEKTRTATNPQTNEIEEEVIDSHIDNIYITIPTDELRGEVVVHSEVEEIGTSESGITTRVTIIDGTKTIYCKGNWSIAVLYVDDLPEGTSEGNVTQSLLTNVSIEQDENLFGTLSINYKNGSLISKIDDIETNGIKKVAAMGNVLLMLTEEGLKYWMWSEGKYKPYNFEGIKDLGVQFGLEGNYLRKYVGNVKTTTTTAVSENKTATQVKVFNVEGRREGGKEWAGVKNNTGYTFAASDFTPQQTYFEKGATYKVEIFDDGNQPKSLSGFGYFYSHAHEDNLLLNVNCGLMLSQEPDVPGPRNRVDFPHETVIADKLPSVVTFYCLDNYPYLIFYGADWAGFSVQVSKIEESSESIFSIDTTDEKEVNVVKGYADKFIAEITEQNKFMYPFLARTAIELTDGTYIYPSAPVLMTPSTSVEPFLTTNSLQETAPIFASAVPCTLNYRFLNQDSIDILKSLNEMIKGIVIAVTPPLYTYKQGATIQEWKNTLHLLTVNNMGGLIGDSYTIDGKKYRPNLEPDLNGYFIEIPSNNIKKQIDEVVDFRIIQHVPLKNIVSIEDWKQVEMETGTLETLLTRTVLSDNIISLDAYIPKSLYLYNNRMTIGNVKLEKFEGYSPDLMNGGIAEDDAMSIETKSRVLLNINGKSVWTKWRVDNYKVASPNLWFYYPHSGAKKAEVYIDAYSDILDTHFCSSWEVDLVEHPHLNGAYAFIDPNDVRSNFKYITKDEYDAVVISDADPLLYPNELMQSRVDNPFVLDGELSSFIGHGEIRALTSATKPVSQGQAGVAPINVFTSDGVWSVGVSKEGKMETVQASDREVILDGVEPLQTDDVVIFATNNGLRLLNGNEVTDISAVLDGYDEVNGLKNMLSQISEFEDFYGSSVVQSNTQQSFVDILPGCKMLWDGANKLVRVFSEGGCYVMDMVSGEWSRSTESMPLAVVAGFPYSIVQDGDRLMQYEKLKDNEELREGVAIVRETAFGSPMYMKMLNDIRTIKKWHGVNGCVLRIVVFVSNDRVTWYRLRSLNAQSWKWYRVAIYSKMTDVDAVEGVICRTEERRGKKLR